jgi:hypothetical protein
VHPGPIDSPNQAQGGEDPDAAQGYTDLRHWGLARQYQRALLAGPSIDRTPQLGFGNGLLQELGSGRSWAGLVASAHDQRAAVAHPWLRQDPEGRELSRYQLLHRGKMSERLLWWMYSSEGAWHGRGLLAGEAQRCGELVLVVVVLCWWLFLGVGRVLRCWLRRRRRHDGYVRGSLCSRRTVIWHFDYLVLWSFDPLVLCFSYFVQWTAK